LSCNYLILFFCLIYWFFLWLFLLNSFSYRNWTWVGWSKTCCLCQYHSKSWIGLLVARTNWNM
jgi:hypothetical protein